VRDRTPDHQVPARTELERLLRDLDRTYEESAAHFEQVAAGMGEGATITARHLRRLASGERQGTTASTRRVLQSCSVTPSGSCSRRQTRTPLSPEVPVKPRRRPLPLRRRSCRWQPYEPESLSWVLPRPT
jgi:hypothetical protein